MINSSKIFEKFLQGRRFKKIIPFLKGSVLDFGGNKGELGKFVKGNYTLINYEHSQMQGKKFDTIAAIAVIEHLDKKDVFELFKKFKLGLNPDGKMVITTPAKMAKPVLEILAFLRILDKKNIEEHKHYWDRKEIFELAEKSGFKIERYKTFQFGFNQFALFRHK